MFSINYFLELQNCNLKFQLHAKDMDMNIIIILFNNPIERYNEDIEDRIKTMRNFGSFEGAENFLNLKTIIHNFINSHMQLQGKTPVEEAEIDLKLGRQKTIKFN